jgi:hypothetical protein
VTDEVNEFEEDIERVVGIYALISGLTVSM